MQGTTEVGTTQTSGGGFYSFDCCTRHLLVKFTRPTTFSNVSPTDATGDDLDSDGLTTAAVTVISGATNNNLDLGLFNLAKIGNFVFNDLDADGVQDVGELVSMCGSGLNARHHRSRYPPKHRAVVSTHSTLFQALTRLSSRNRRVFSSVSPSDATSDDLDSDGLTTAVVTLVSGAVNNNLDLGLFNVASNVCIAIDMQGNTATSGTHGNVRTFSAGGVFRLTQVHLVVHPQAFGLQLTWVPSVEAWRNRFIRRTA